LAFQSDRDGNWDVFIIDADGSGLRALTRDGADDEHPVWSPSGDRIAFGSTRSGHGDIYLVNPDGTGLRRLTDHEAYEGAPSWSADGRFIAFEGERDGSSQLYRVDVETLRVERLTDSRRRKLGPNYAPDGLQLAFMEKGLIWWQVAILNLRTERIRSLTEGSGNCRPAWSPDGGTLAFVSSRESRKADLWMTDVAKGTAWRVPSRPNAYNYDPAFSSDGETLAFASTVVRTPEQWDLFVVDVNGKGLEPLTSGPGNDRFPEWRPSHSAGSVLAR
jgi:Tol biopolymer transport system component